MAKRSVTITAAWITFAGVLIAAVVGAVVTIRNWESGSTTNVTTANAHEGPLVVASGSKNVTINYTQESPERAEAIKNLSERLESANAVIGLSRDEVSLVKVALTTLTQRTKGLENPRMEKFSFDDRDRMFLAHKPDDAVLIFFVLNTTPLLSGVRLQFDNALARPDTVTNINNVLVTCFAGGVEPLKKKEFFITYTPNPEAVNSTSRVEVLNNELIVVDGIARDPGAKYVEPGKE
jgi:hypothetical protein